MKGSVSLVRIIKWIFRKAENLEIITLFKIFLINKTCILSVTNQILRGEQIQENPFEALCTKWRTKDIKISSYKYINISTIVPSIRDNIFTQNHQINIKEYNFLTEGNIPYNKLPKTVMPNHQMSTLWNALQLHYARRHAVTSW